MASRNIGTLRARDAVSETMANLESRWVTSASVFLVVLVLAFASMTTVVSETSEIASYQQELYEKGATGFVVADDAGENGLSATRCEELNHVDGVVSAGARGDLMPNESGVPARQVSAGYVSSVHPETPSAARTVAGSTIATSMHFVRNSGIDLAGAGIVPLGTVAASSDRDPRADGEILVVWPAAAMHARECVVIGSLSAVSGVAGLLTNWFAPQPTSVTPLAPNAAAAPSPHDRFAARMSLAVPIVAGCSAVLAMLGVWVSRRSDFALYRLLGAKRAPLMIGLALECAVLVSVPSGAGIGFALAARPVYLTGPVLEVVMLAALQFIVVGLASLPAGVLLLLTKNPADLIREGYDKNPWEDQGFKWT